MTAMYGAACPARQRWAKKQLLDPRISIVIPVYNEQAILHAAVVDLRERLRPYGWSYEIILAENGSRDRTIEIAEELGAKYPDEVRFISLGEPNYGKALKQGILLARGAIVICDEIDLCDADFHRRALDILDSGEADLVIGSKLLAGAEDDRPMLRHAAGMA
jgi:glycosyltransferase involved in cell wall biosynthesis